MGGVGVRARPPENPAMSGVYASVAQVGVLVAAGVVMVVSRASFRTIGWRLGPATAYLGVLVAVTLVVALSVGAAFELGDLKFASPSPVQIKMLTISAPFMLMFTCLFSFCEEFGWRGFLLPKLLPLGVGRALLLSGAIWFLWEAPLVWFGMLDGGIGRVNMPLTLGLHLIGDLSIGVAFGYLRLRFASIFLPAFAHGLLNSLGGIAITLMVQVNSLWGDFDGVIGTGVTVIVGILAFGLALRSERAGTLNDADAKSKIT
jgi:membrane protease YdiL (CAAX protease family)